MRRTFASCKNGSCIVTAFSAEHLFDGHLRALLKQKGSCIARTRRSVLSHLRHAGVCAEHRQAALAQLASEAASIEAARRGKDVQHRAYRRRPEQVSVVIAT